MLRKLHGRVVCLAPASEHGAEDGLGAALSALSGEPSKAEVEAAESLAKEEGNPPAEDQDKSTEGEKAEETSDQSTEASAEDLTPKLAAAEEEVKALAGQVTLLKDLNASLNNDKAQLQVQLDNQATELDAAKAACDALKPAAIRQIKVLSISVNEPVPHDLADKSAAELGSVCASLLSKLENYVPGERKSSEVPSGSDGEPAPTVVPTAAESGLSGI